MNKQKIIKILKFSARWGIAIVGVWYVLSRMSWHDQILGMLPGQKSMQVLRLAAVTNEASLQYPVIDPISGGTIVLPRADTANAPDKDKLRVMEGDKPQYVVGVDLSADLKTANRLLLADEPKGPLAHWAPVSAVTGYRVTIPHPRVQIGVVRMVQGADLRFFLAALLVMPITILITSVRWHELLKALEIRLTLGRTFVLNMVGIFYNSFMPGSTGGDLLKAYYVAKQTHHRTRAVMSVLVDRAIGLLALIILGGTMASFQWHNEQCRQVAIGSAVIIVCAILGALLFYVPGLRKASGLDWIINKLPMQKQVNKAIETMHIYGNRFRLVAGALAISFPVHVIVILAAYLCGLAFSLPVGAFYYWMAVPVIVLAGSIPISPQGAGVMEYFAIMLLEPQGATVGQAFALTMSIRLTQIFWNLTGGVFVLRGGYHAPTQSEQKEVEDEDEDKDKNKDEGMAA